MTNETPEPENWYPWPERANYEISSLGRVRVVTCGGWTRPEPVVTLDAVLIPITGRVNRRNGVVVAYAKVLPEQVQAVVRFSWHMQKGYASTRLPRCEGHATLFMHNVFLPHIKGLVVDHANGDKLDNRLSNLRRATHVENGQNATWSRATRKTVARGVSKGRNGWFARIKWQGETIHLGTYDTPAQASEAYETKAKELFKRFYRPVKDA